MKLNLIVNSPDELQSKAHSHYLDVTSDRKRKSYNFENEMICFWLGCIADHVSFPFELVGSEQGKGDLERPDFKFVMAGVSFGIELTKAANRDYEWAKNLASSAPDSILEPSLYSPNSLIDEKEAKPPVSNANKPLYGPGWIGYKPEEEWSDYIFHSIQGKTIKLAEDSFNKFDENWLLIHDSTPVRMFLHDEFLTVGMQMLQTKMDLNYWAKSITFNRIYVQCTDQMVLLEKNLWSKFPLPSWKPSWLTPS